jgi:hypothetical protein
MKKQIEKFTAKAAAQVTQINILSFPAINKEVPPDFASGMQGSRNYYSRVNIHQIEIYGALVKSGHPRSVAGYVVREFRNLGAEDWWFKQVAGFESSKSFYYPYLMIRSRETPDGNTFTSTSLMVAGEVKSHVAKLGDNHESATEFERIEFIGLKPIIDRIEKRISELEEVRDYV